MKSLAEIEEEIRPVLKQVEKIRVQNLQGTSLSWLVPLLISALSFYFGYQLFQQGSNAFVGFLFFPVLVWFFFMALRKHPSSKEKKYLSIFRKKVLGNLVEELYPKASYYHYSSISVNSMERSQLLFNSKYKDVPYYKKGTVPKNIPLKKQDSNNPSMGYTQDLDYVLEDYFTGYTSQHLFFKFAEIKQTNFPTTTAPAKGVFFEINFSQEVFLHTPVFLLPKPHVPQSDQHFQEQSLATFLEEHNIHYWKEEKAFYAPYVIYHSPENEPEEVLTPAILGAVYNLYKQWGRYLQVSIFRDNIYLFLDYKEDWLETSLQQPVIKSDLLKDIYSQLVVCFHLLEDIGREEWQPSKIAIGELVDWEKELYKHLIVK